MSSPISIRASGGTLVSLASLLIALIVFGGCSPAGKTAPNVVLISIDTLRSDHLGAYGYGRPTSPVIDGFASKGVVFEQAVANSPWTLPSHGSMLTGLFPRTHGLKGFDTRLADGTPTLATLLSGAGYATLGLVNAPNLARRHGFERGFDQYVMFPPITRGEQTRCVNRQIDRAIEWLDSLDDGPFFIFLHNYDVHSTYDPSDEFLEQFASPYDGEFRGGTFELQKVRAGRLEMDSEDLRHVVDRYDAGIRELDHDLERLLEYLDDRGSGENTIVILTSDHGEEFMEHGGTLHGRTMYEEVLAVPLMVRGPGIPAGHRVPGLVQLTDVLPTVAELAGVSVPEGVEGESLVGTWSRGEPIDSRRFAYAEADHRNDEDDILRMVRLGAIKLIHNRVTLQSRLFDLRRDPREVDDLAEKDPETLRTLDAAMRNYMDLELESTADLPPLTDEQLERLRSLGYVQ